MIITKRNGDKQEFNFDKIDKAVRAAFNSLDRHYSDEESDISLVLRVIKDSIRTLCGDGCSTVEDVQNIVEKALMSCGHYDVAKSYILYREKHREAREHADKDWNFIQRFVKSSNTANATIDDNSNVSNHNIAVLNAEIHKEDNKNSNIEIWSKKVVEMFPELTRKQMLTDFDTILYGHDLSSQILMPYCAAVSLYPFITGGLSSLGGKSAIPKSLESFCGIFVNLIFALASEVKGAIGTAEALVYFDYFARKEWGNDYYLRKDENITSCSCKTQRTIEKQIHQYFQQITYSINQVASSRGAQSPFTNFQFFDKYFFDGMFSNFAFPDGDKPCWESTNWLQKNYLHWLNQERLKCMLTFPVCTYSCMIENDEFKDLETKDFICQEYSEGNSFFLYTSTDVDSICQCCRLRSIIEENTFSFTNGLVGVKSGSKNVITLNLNRIVQDWYNQPSEDGNDLHTFYAPNSGFKPYLEKILDRVYKYQIAYNELLKWCFDNKLFMMYSAGFIDLDKQYLTVGVNGLLQAAEFLGLQCNNNKEYQKFCKFIFETIKDQNTLHRTKETRFNTEITPYSNAVSKPFLIDLKLL